MTPNESLHIENRVPKPVAYLVIVASAMAGVLVALRLFA
jgi:hypothetical protein